MDTNEKLQALKAFHAGMGDKNYFELLGVDESADDAAIRTAYFNLLKLYGADYFHHVVDSEGRNAVDEVNAQLRKAYDTLSKKARRDAYIESLHGNGDMAQNVDMAAVFEAEQAVSQAKALMERGEFNVAIQKLEKAHRIDPKSPEVSARLQYSRFMVSEVDKSGKRNSFTVKETLECLELACENMPKADFLRVYLGDVEKLNGNTENALNWYREALKLNKENYTAKREIMLIEERQKKALESEKAPAGFLDKIKSFLESKGLLSK